MSHKNVTSYLNEYQNITRMLSEGNDLGKLISNPKNSEVRNSILVLLYLMQNPTSFKVFNGLFPDKANKSGFSELLSMSAFLSKCDDKNREFFIKISTNLMKQAVVKLKKLDRNIMNEKASELMIKLENKAISANTIKFALNDIFPNSTTIPKGDKVDQIATLKTSIKSIMDSNINQADNCLVGLINAIIPFIKYENAIMELNQLGKNLLIGSEKEESKSSCQEIFHTEKSENTSKSDADSIYDNDEIYINSVMVFISESYNLVVSNIQNYNQQAVINLKTQLENLRPKFKGQIESSLTGSINGLLMAMSEVIPLWGLEKASNSLSKLLEKDALTFKRHMR